MAQPKPGQPDQQPDQQSPDRRQPQPNQPQPGQPDQPRSGKDLPTIHAYLNIDEMVDRVKT